MHSRNSWVSDTFSPSDWQVLSQFWYPIALQREVTGQPIGVTLLDQPLVIWRSASGVSVADDRCPHRGVPLSMGDLRGDDLVCPYHGLHYSATGQCTKIPADSSAIVPSQLCLKTYPVIEAYGLIWTSLMGAPQTTDQLSGLPHFPEWNDPNYQQILPDSLFLETSAGRQIGRASCRERVLNLV